MTATLAPGDVKRRDDSDRDVKIERLNTVSQKRVVDPDVHIAGSISQSQVLPDALLSISGLDLDLSPEQRAKLSREEVASIVDNGIRFEAVLEMGFAHELVGTHDFTDPRVTYLLHEMGEETRHQRLFVRLVAQLAPTAKNPFQGGIVERILGRVIRRVIRMPATLYTLVLGGEEIPDLFQKLASEHPDTDPFIRDVNRYHRMEEARHLSFARIRLGEVWATTSRRDRFAVRHVVPRFIAIMFATLVHPGVYSTVGLPARSTWKAANRSPQRRAIRAAACQPVLDAVVAAGAIKRSRIPRAWRQLVAGADPAYVASLTPA